MLIICLSESFNESTVDCSSLWLVRKSSIFDQSHTCWNNLYFGFWSVQNKSITVLF